MAVTERLAPGELRDTFRGPLVVPGDADYDAVRAVYNGMVDNRPLMIARCTGTADVIAAVRFAREHDVQVAVRGGGHNLTGHSMSDGGMTIDLSLMRACRVDPRRRRAFTQGGATWAGFDRENEVYGLATPGGVVSTTGVGGFSLIGGMGWLMRRHGLTLDNVRGVELVTADGEVLHANAEENAELYWGVRGAGPNFGVVTTFEHEVHPTGPIVYAGSMFFPVERSGELLRLYREYMEAPASDDLTIWLAWLAAPEAPHVPPEVQGQMCFAIAGCWAGVLEQGEEVLRPWREAGPLVDEFQPRLYTNLQQMLDKTAAPGGRNYWKSDYYDSLSDELIDAIVEWLPGLTRYSQFHLGEMGGFYPRVGEEETAFRRRDARYFTQFVTMWYELEQDEREIEWTRAFADALKPYATGGVYLNFIGDEGQRRVREAYGAKWDRLVALKRRYDPDNFFRLNQNILPDA